MWRLWNFLFGWDYVLCVPTGWIFKIDIFDGLPVLIVEDERVVVHSFDHIEFLTCRPSKYMKAKYED